jgi:hypothetical protein
MKKPRAGEILREQCRAANRVGFVHEQAAIGLIRKKQLADSENDERIQTAQNDGEENGRHNGAAEFGKNVFHKFSKFGSAATCCRFSTT